MTSARRAASFPRPSAGPTSTPRPSGSPAVSSRRLPRGHRRLDAQGSTSPRGAGRRACARRGRAPDRRRAARPGADPLGVRRGRPRRGPVRPRGGGRQRRHRRRSTAPTTSPGGSWRARATRCVRSRSGPGGWTGDVAERVDAGTRLVAFSAVQAATGHRSDIPAIGAAARAVGALVFVDGSQLVGAIPVADDLSHLDVLATSDHKFLLNAGRGMGYCYLSPAAQEGSLPSTPAGGRGGAVRQLLRPRDGALRRRRASTARSAGWPRSATSAPSPCSRISASTRSTTATMS